MFNILEIIVEQMGIEAGGRHLPRALRISLPPFLFQIYLFNLIQAVIAFPMQGEKRRCETMLRFVLSFPLQCFEVEVFCGPGKLTANLLAEDRSLEEMRSGTGQNCPSTPIGVTGACFWGPTRVDLHTPFIEL